ncbi:tRNA uridine-5-carboxymethylaminomethyl(34) synthesis GTPase MnmE [Aestuariicoccus sp. MJ-SS9]|uniref:tRNA uridine-5-carboxymethylaminomethyl(34) synthesis GTPase MnmE n=1 Tax=Aestuariicoccus sp. MJ-SS9 TaxID=3079855 RepID=UPI00290FEB99|nr:tRNA uridine-5-carboxymethylaminomethyl(34) synthesis GTPase MnmE [Aestuariicoccus sp. MJ-SS9]MDU8910910.1 tRNA uridine-5-carboxymethylaminomethyl(34) synthesis GTPase MnmE [Aestuariicoccus sp. MJ-SS9]
MDTIFALATAEGKSGVAIIRISGPASWAAVERLCGSLPAPRMAGLRRLRAADGSFLDDPLVLCFEQGASFTGEQSAELHLHGSIAVVRAVLRELGALDGLRQAEPGEFTRRAMENGRLDLIQVEALADLIESETELQRQQALAVHEGAFGDKVAVWRRDLIRAAALLEATIDFADEDVPVDVSDEVRELLQKTDADLEQQIAGSFISERVRTGFEVAIVGAPNVGKSTLLNALAGREAAITSDIAGTTRDVIEVRMDLDGLPVTILDTAGMRDTDDVIEAMGVKRALERAQSADLRIFLIDEGTDLPVDPSPDDLVRTTKADMTGDPKGISAKSGQGVSELIAEIKDRLVHRVRKAGLASRERHRVAMIHGRENIAQALEILEHGPEQYDIAAEEVRVAAQKLSALVGHVDVEHLLDEIFASFCLGK